MTGFNSSLGHAVLISDGLSGHTNLCNLLSLTHTIHSYPLSDIEHIDLKNAVFIVLDIDLSHHQTLKTIETFLGMTNKVGISTLFILKTHSRRNIVQLYSLGGNEFITHPVTLHKLKPFVHTQSKKASETSWNNLPKTQAQALRHSLDAFDHMISNATQGKPLNTKELNKSSQAIIEATTSHSLSNWISALDTHHNRSFSHSLTVCGYFVGFAHELGIKSADLQKVALAGLVHDIGKCRVPTEILDKPARLNPLELREIRKHPACGYNLLISSSQKWDEDILDAVRHHHENIDGSGYPDSLYGSEISNMTSLLIITDIFSALTEKRAYKEAMSPEDAYDKMLGMNNKFDKELLKAFKPIALMPQKATA